eukprot:TRINITY_DN67836_c9_g3_i1.p1 TRINITY_DN67836_c9_g3~~TRINITY_DN67836_c9_g3_i1.p1  ORF type:complete len:623 (-),score=88.77 TRINITY_DN67836_c9_g3_i1:111-1979(-)
MSLPDIHGQSSVVSGGISPQGESKDEMIARLQREVETLQNANRQLADQQGYAAPPPAGSEEQPFLPRSPLSARDSAVAAAPRPSPPASSPGLHSAPPRPVHAVGRVAAAPPIGTTSSSTPRKPAAEPPREHPLKQEYREIQESAMRWVTTDQPFIRGGKPGINMCDDVGEDFFRSLSNQATFNLPKELRYALAMAKESQDKMMESLDVLAQSQKTVDKTSADTLLDVRNDFELARDRLRNKQLYFTNEIAQYREEMAHKIDTELAIVGLLIKTLDDSIAQANNVLERNLRPDNENDGHEYKSGKTLNDIRAEYNHFRKTIMPGLMKGMREEVAGRAAELLALDKGASIHDIISALLATLESALLKARGTEERLEKHKVEVELMCDAALKEMDGDWEMFRAKLKSKEESVIAELHNYREDTTTKVQANAHTIHNYLEALQDHIQFASRILEKGNDYQMFRQTKEMKNQMVLMYSELAKMRLQYDGILFQTASNELDVPIDYIGTLMNAATKAAVDWSPTANKQRSKDKHIAQEILTAEEARLMRDLFKTYDKDNSGNIDVHELKEIWKQVWRWATDKEVEKVAERVLQQVDADNSGTVEFEEFMKILDLGFGDESAEGGAFHL